MAASTTLANPIKSATPTASDLDRPLSIAPGIEGSRCDARAGKFMWSKGTSHQEGKLELSVKGPPLDEVFVLEMFGNTLRSTAKLNQKWVKYANRACAVIVPLIEYSSRFSVMSKKEPTR